MRFAVEEINNSTGPQSLLPGVKLGYQMYDICSLPASVLATLDVLEQHYHSPSTSDTEGGTDSFYNSSQKTVAVVGPDSSSKSFTPAALFGAFLIPQVSLCQYLNHCIISREMLYYKSEVLLIISHFILDIL